MTTKLPGVPPTVAETLGSESIQAARAETVSVVSFTNGTTVPVPSTVTESESPVPKVREIGRVSTWAMSGSFATTFVEATAVQEAERVAENGTPGVFDSKTNVRVPTSTDEATVPIESIAVLRSERVVSESVVNGTEAEPVPTVTVRTSPEAGTNGTASESFCATATTFERTEAGAVVPETSTHPTVNGVPAVAASRITVVEPVRLAVTSQPAVSAETSEFKVTVPSVTNDWAYGVPLTVTVTVSQATGRCGSVNASFWATAPIAETTVREEAEWRISP